MFCFCRVQCIRMLTKSKNRFLPTYNKLIPPFWFGLHILIVPVCMFVVLFNRSLRPDFSISAWNDETDTESAARRQGEVFSIFYLGNFKADHNCKS